MSKYKVYVNEPNLKGREKKYLIKSINDGFISSSGPFVKKFEKKFAKRVNRKKNKSRRKGNKTSR